MKLNYDLEKLCSGLINDFLSMNTLGIKRKIKNPYLHSEPVHSIIDVR